LALAALALFGCNQTVSGLSPANATTGSPLAEERFLRRLHLDLTGSGPTPDQLAAEEQLLSAAGDASPARASIADQVLKDPAFAATFVAELTNRVLAGDQLTARYDLICAGYRNYVPACMTCPMPADGMNLCANCACPDLMQLWAEEQSLLAAPADLGNGTSTGEIERRFGGSYLLQYSFGDQNALAQAVFGSFLGKKASPDEQLNAGMLAFAQPGSGNHGLLFHRLGGSFADLTDIVFTSEVYRDAAVAQVFVRYLGRPPSPVERAYFVGQLDPQKPDVRAVIKAVVASNEYFAQ
jgi:hypothetical protein